MSSAFKRTVWLYKRANFTDLNNTIATFYWTCRNDGTADEASLLFMIVLMQCIKTTIPHKKLPFGHMISPGTILKSASCLKNVIVKGKKLLTL